MNKRLRIFFGFFILFFFSVFLISCKKEVDNTLENAAKSFKVSQILGKNVGANQIIYNLELIDSIGEVEVTFESTNLNIINNEGQVFRQDEDVAVTLFVTFTYKKEYKKDAIVFKVLKLEN